MLSKRISESIEQWFKKDYRATFYERIEYLIESEKIYEDLPYAVRYGKTLEYTLDRISVFVQDGEKIVGSVKEIIPTEEQKEAVEELSKDWWDKDLEEVQESILWFYSYGWLKRRPPWFYSFGHLSLNWEKILNVGLKGYKEEAIAKLQNDKNKNKQDFIHGAVICYDALSSFITRYADEVAIEADHCEKASRKEELITMSESLKHISEQPARNFYEALQLLWLIILPLQKVTGCGVFNFSRMDQYLLPFYEKDIQEGLLTEEEALELIIEFYNKNNEIMAPTDHMSQEIETTNYTIEVAYDDPNYIILAGKLVGGKPGVNKLSYLFVEAAHRLGLRNPWIVVRYYDGIDETFWLKVTDAMRDNSSLVVYNDESMIPALLDCGVDDEDVMDYGFYGCNDPVIPAKEGGLRQLWFNLLRPVELSLNSGDCPMNSNKEKIGIKGVQGCLEDRMIGTMTGPYYGIDCLKAGEINGLDDLIDIYRLQLRHLIEGYRDGFEKDFEIEKQSNKGRIRIEDCFLEGTIDHAISWNNGGTKYHKVLIQGGGIGSVVDSFAAIEELVFKTEEYTLPELVDILNNNFEGNELLKKRMEKQMPKFGNDIEWVDDIARRVVDIFCDEVIRVNSNDYLYDFYPTLSTDRDFTGAGKGVGATPDGRSAKDAISENQSPSVGMDKEGITALFNSEAKIAYNRITGGPLNVKIHPSAVKGDKGLQALASAMKTYMKKGGLQVQINVVSKETLLDAQQNPDKYADLCVRVTGYSAYFVQMGKKAQDELISRSEKR